ncbi:MAG: PqqD family protein [Clostridia bacterium]|jgi:hypothetical protein|nr:PqqD family protein [Clostridia bacterium]
MRIKDNFVLRELCGNYVVVAVGEQTLNFKGLVKLNETGAFLWQKLAAEEISEHELLNALLSEYDVDEATAKTDVREFVTLLQEADLLI